MGKNECASFSATRPGPWAISVDSCANSPMREDGGRRRRGGKRVSPQSGKGCVGHSPKLHGDGSEMQRAMPARPIPDQRVAERATSGE